MKKRLEFFFISIHSVDRAGIIVVLKIIFQLIIIKIFKHFIRLLGHTVIKILQAHTQISKIFLIIRKYFTKLKLKTSA